LAAARIHFLSPRWSGPFLKLNCAALSPDLLETELFGHEAGAFTGAIRQRIGRFEAASGGTLFLDEIAQMPMSLQEKILRVVEYGSFERVGGSTTITVEVRLVGATNANLMDLAEQGKFKRSGWQRLYDSPHGRSRLFATMDGRGTFVNCGTLWNEQYIGRRDQRLMRSI
jgi:psp operon transcriptional activator